jgi:serine protease AprX
MFRRSHPPAVASITVLALVLALVAAAPAPDADGVRVPERPVTIHAQLAAELLEGDAPLAATATAIVTTHHPSGLDAVEAAGVTGTRLDALGMLLVPALSGQQLMDLQQLPEVRSIWGEEELELHMQESVWVTGARDVWEDHGYTGSGVELAVVDTGADGTHLDFGNLIEFCNASATGTLGFVPCTTDRREAVDDNGHGTHVAGTMAGTGRGSGGRTDPHATIGMAPDASIRSYAANVAASLLNTDILAAYDDLIAKKRSGENDIVAINNSFGGGIGSDYDPDDPQAIAYRTANEAGMLPVFSAGNSGPDDNTLGRQCLSPYVLCVGASTKTDGITAFSSVGRPAAPHPTAPGEDAAEPTGYDNHDRALARAFDLGVYRPGIVAPGAVINAMSANAPLCRDGMLSPDGCYEELQGTSMSAPHVTGAAALVAEAFRDAHDRTPTADELLDILERSATPLPGHPAEQQGAGRLDVPAAIDLALTYDGDGAAEPAWLPVGTPIPSYVEGKHPGGDTLLTEQVGCTGPGSFTLKDEAGVTAFEVPAGAHELTVEVDWGAYHPDANLYLELFRPGHDPASSGDDPGPTRTFPVAESAGLVHTDPIVDDVGPPATSRSVSFPGPEDGEWSLRVTHRLGGTVQPCQADDDNTEGSQRDLGFSYDVEVHVTQVEDLPTTTLHRGAEHGDAAELFGTAAYPAPIEGVTTWAAPGSTADAADDGDEVERTTYHLTGSPDDALTTEGTFGTDEPTAATPLLQTAGGSLADPDVPSNPLAITWTGPFDGRVDGDLRFDWWWATPNVLGGLIDVEVVVTVFADPDPDGGAQPDAVIGRRTVRLQALPEALGAVRNVTSVPVRGEVAGTLQVQVTPVYVDTGPALTAFYGSADTPSSFGVPAEATAPTADVDAPEQLRITDLQDRLRLAWDPVDGAERYAVYRSTDPGFTVGPDTLRGTTEGTACRAPDVPSWPGASRDGLCVVDGDVTPGTTYYYRVVAIQQDLPGAPSLLGYGTPTAPERLARVQVDRIFGPGYWEPATPTDASVGAWTHRWDLRGVVDPAEPRARVFSQGVGSLVAEVTEAPEDPAPTDPEDPDEPTDPDEPGEPSRPGRPADRPGPPGERPPGRP